MAKPQEKGKPKFIRKNGKVIPIGVDKKKGASGSGGKPKKKKDWKGAEKQADKVFDETRKQGDIHRKQKAHAKPFATIGALGLGAVGALAGKKAGGGAVALFGGLLGLSTGGNLGKAVSKRTKKGKTLSNLNKASHKREMSSYRKGNKLVGKDNFGDVIGETFTTRARQEAYKKYKQGF